MHNEKDRESICKFIRIAKEEINTFFNTVSELDYTKAADIIEGAEKNGNRIHITGIGKPSHVAAYAASLFSSTGTPTYFLDGTEAVHGSCGQLVSGDVVICISNSGETSEMKSTIMAVKRNDCKVISVTGNQKSWLAEKGDACLFAGVSKEGGPLNRAPRISVLAEIFVLQGLSICLQKRRGLTPWEYIRWHPGGVLGHLREEETGGDVIGEAQK